MHLIKKHTGHSGLQFMTQHEKWVPWCVNEATKAWLLKQASSELGEEMDRVNVEL